jgi:hypothetical protein
MAMNTLTLRIGNHYSFENQKIIAIFAGLFGHLAHANLTVIYHFFSINSIL